MIKPGGPRWLKVSHCALRNVVVRRNLDIGDMDKPSALVRALVLVLANGRVIVRLGNTKYQTRGSESFTPEMFSPFQLAKKETNEKKAK